MTFRQQAQSMCNRKRNPPQSSPAFKCACNQLFEGKWRYDEHKKSCPDFLAFKVRVGARVR